MQRTVDLEDELKKANAARSQLDTYKKQVCTRFWPTIPLNAQLKINLFLWVKAMHVR